MKKQNTFASLNSEIKITVFQALTLLAKAYRHDKYSQRIHDKILHLYLSGIRTQRDSEILDELLQDELLNNYTISVKKEEITNDPVRRYFESHLCHRTLLNSLDPLDMDQLSQHFFSIVDQIDEGYKVHSLQVINGESPSFSPNEYSIEVRNLKKSDSYRSFKPEDGSGKTSPVTQSGRASPDAQGGRASPDFQGGRSSPDDILDERKRKMLLLAKCMFAALYVEETTEITGKPFDIYHLPNNVFGPLYRGRVRRRDQDTGAEQNVRPHTLGIMRSWMPLSVDDALFAEEPAELTRPADIHTYKKGSFLIPNQIFFSKVTPFVNSISGTMLVKLRVIATLLREQKFVYMKSGENGEIDTEQLTHYLKSFIAYMIYNAGGHSLSEYISVLQLPEVQEEFSIIPDFSSITLDSLFRDKNKDAFNGAMEQTIKYNDHILSTKKMHGQLKISHHLNGMINHKIKHIPVKHTEPTTDPSMLGTVVLHVSPEEHKYSVMNSTVVGGALLFGLIRLLNAEQLPLNKPDNVLHRFRELLLIVSMLAVARTFGADIIKQAPAKSVVQRQTSNISLSHIVSVITATVLNYSIFRPAEEVGKVKPLNDDRLTA